MKRLDSYKKIKLFKPLLSFIAAIALVACGGDGDVQNPFGAQNGLVVIETNPISGADFVDPTLPIEIRFNTAVATASAQGRVRATLVDTGIPLDVTISFTQGDTVMLINPTGGTGQLPGNSQIRVEIDPGMQSVFGNSLLNPFTMVFNTDQGSNNNISQPGTNVSVIQMIPALNNAIIPPGNYTTQMGWVMQIVFSECVQLPSLDANLFLTYEDELAIGNLFGGSGEVPINRIVQPSGFDTRTFYVYINANLQFGYNVRLKILQSMQDCNNDNLAGGSGNAPADFSVKFDVQ